MYPFKENQDVNLPLTEKMASLKPYTIEEITESIETSADKHFSFFVLPDGDVLDCRRPLYLTHLGVTDMIYENISSNTGYTGTLESALIPEDVYTAVFSQTKNNDGLVIETADDTKKYIALMTEFQMDASARRYCFYRCMLTRPSVTGATIETATTPQTETVNITVSPRPDDKVIRVFCDKDDNAYSGFFLQVPTP